MHRIIFETKQDKLFHKTGRQDYLPGYHNIVLFSRLREDNGFVFLRSFYYSTFYFKC